MAETITPAYAVGHVLAFWTFTDHGIEELNKLLHELTPNQECKEGVDDLREFLMTGYLILASNQDQHRGTIGIARLIVKHTPVPHGEIHDVIVDEHHRHQGIGTALLEEALRYARAKKLSLRYVDVLVEPQQIDFKRKCQSLGFVPVPPAEPGVEGSSKRYRLML